MSDKDGRVTIRIDGALQRRINKARKELEGQLDTHTMSSSETMRFLLRLGLEAWENLARRWEDINGTE